VFGDRIHVTLAGDSEESEERFARALTQTALAAAPIRRVQPSLEDVFIARLSAEKEAARA
jgi:hypothetical protein